MKEAHRLFVRILMIFCCVVLLPMSAKAIDMSPYWPVKPAVVWGMDHDILIVGMESHPFGALLGQQVLSASTFCDDGPCGENYFYMYSGSSGILILGVYNDSTFIDISANPFTIAAADMDIGGSVVSVVPAGDLGPGSITLTSTLKGQEDVTVPAGSYQDCLVLQLQIVEAPGSFIEKIWLADGVGPVKMERVSETPAEYDGCFFTCGSFDEDAGTIVATEFELQFLLGLEVLDVDNNGQLGLAEAIHTLKVVSGQ